MRNAVAPVLAACLLFPTTALARPCGELSADRAFQQAALVVKGWFEYTRIEGVPPPLGSDLTSIIRVDRVLKGATSRTRIAVTHFLCFENRIAMRTDRPLIAFVTASGSLVDGSAVLPASQLNAAEVTDDPKATVRAEFLLGATDSDPIVARAALGALAQLDGEASSAILRQAVDNPDLGVRVRALTWLTRFGDVDAFRRLTQTLSEWPFTPFSIPRLIQDDEGFSLAIAEDDVRHALYTLAVDPAVSTGSLFRTRAFLELVTTVAQLDELSLRRMAFQVMRHAEHSMFFPILVNALTDPDKEIRRTAIYTLCNAMHAADLPCGPSYVETGEQRYVYRIRAWRKARQ
ncbi:MAG TPA: HEAT repeat domain-containing protein [Vicinamibacterales bacterium]|nr:HEAT repeat domain-containing protein [Vicinamibacterales bacterium]